MASSPYLSPQLRTIDMPPPFSLDDPEIEGPTVLPPTERAAEVAQRHLHLPPVPARQGPAPVYHAHYHVDGYLAQEGYASDDDIVYRTHLVANGEEARQAQFSDFKEHLNSFLEEFVSDPDSAPCENLKQASFILAEDRSETIQEQRHLIETLANILNHDKHILLFCAAKFDFDTLIKDVIVYGEIYINRKDPDTGNTALHLAISQKALKSISTLLALGADLWAESAQNRDGWTPYDFAQRDDDQKVYEVIHNYLARFSPTGELPNP